MSENVVSFDTRRPLAETLAAQREEHERAERETAEIRDLEMKTKLEAIDQFRALVEKGEIHTFMILGTHVTGHYYTDVLVPHERNFNQDAFGLIGLLETIKVEFTEAAAMAPCVRSDGAILTPAPDEEEYDG